MKSLNEIYLAVSGTKSENSDEKTDLFDVSGLLPNNLVAFRKYLSENSINDEDTVLPQPSTIKSMEQTI